MKSTPHLWEVDHDYYCSEGNYFAKPGETLQEFKSWPDFLAEEGDADLSYNLLFRFDWKEGEDEGASDFNGDVNYRNGKLFLFWMGQRKGLFRTTIVEVCRADEPQVVEFLKARWAHLKKLWLPLSGDAK